jgi:hypothetical protein
VFRLVLDVIEVGDWHPEPRCERGHDVVVGRQALRNCRFPETLWRFFRQLREACRIDKRLQRRDQPVIPGRTIIASQLSLPDSRIGRN